MMASPNTRTTVLPWDDVKLGAVLGEGSYSAVHAVSTLPHGSVLLEATETGGSKHYALKRLHAKILCDEKMCRAASADMAAEATILAILPLHENIIRLRAISTGFWDCPEEGFLLLDRLHETLDCRISHWREQEEQVISPLFGRQRQRCREQQARVSYAAIGIAKGMEFLHRHGVIYRDLKPANIGFDQEGRVQIFDFGLARIIPKGSDDLRLAGSAGTARYMAPEVARSDFYTLPADIHSFAIVLWEICTLRKPFAEFAIPASFVSRVVHGDVRPTIRKIGSKRLKELLQASWHPNPDARPSFGTIVEQLELETKTTCA